MKDGDYFVVRTRGWFAWLIRRVTRSPYNHAAIVYDAARKVTIEAEPRGACLGWLPFYDKCAVAYSTLDLTDAQRSTIIHKAASLMGTPYGWLDLVALGLLQYHFRPRWVKRIVDRRGALVCSQLVALCYLEAGIRLSRDPECDLDVTPGDLAFLAESRRGLADETRPHSGVSMNGRGS